MIVVPAYGRDYPTKADAVEAFRSGVDFLVADISHPYNGSYCSRRDLKDDDTVVIRHNQCRDRTVIHCAEL